MQNNGNVAAQFELPKLACMFTLTGTGASEMSL